MGNDMLKGKADLHSHTTASDGLLSPKELVEWAAAKGLAALAITDHDTTAGINEGISAGKKAGIEVIPGIELNTQIGSIEIHILGYFIDMKSCRLQDTLTKIRDSRDHRGRLMTERLALCGIKLGYDEVLRQSKGGAVGRPHIARALVALGIVDNVQEAFEKYLNPGCVAYSERYRLTPSEGITLIKESGGVAVLAHPGLLPDDSLLYSLCRMGIQGIEAYHSKHTQVQSDFYSNFANEHKLLITGGSDCHGELINGKPIVGNVTVGLSNIDAIKKVAKNIT